MVWLFSQRSQETNAGRESLVDSGKMGINKKNSHIYTVKRVDEVVRHPHLVTQDQNTQVSNKFFDIPVENFTINIEFFRH